MMKMLIQLDEEKIMKDGTYKLADMWKLIDEQFTKQRCVKEVQADNSVIYKGNPRDKDQFTAFGFLFLKLNQSKWFVENCKTWKLCEEFENSRYSISVNCLVGQCQANQF